MSDAAPQNLATHRRFVPGFHFVAIGLIALVFFWRLYLLFTAFSVESVMSLLLVVAVGLLAWYARIFALTVQDRVIRLEERLRLERLLPVDLKPSVDRFTRGQLIALRFASDAELPELARAVLAGEVTGREEIKKRVKSWRADHLRA